MGPDMDGRIISAGFVQDALDSLRGTGTDTRALLVQAGIDPDLSGPVSHLQYGQLWLAIAARIDDEFFGLAARPMRPGSFALMCHAVLNARDLEQALHRALRFLEVMLKDPSGRLRLRDGQAEIVLTDHEAPRRAFAYRSYWLILLGLMCWLIGRRIALARVDFSCAAPPNRQDYHQFFGAPVQFDQPHSRLVFAASYLKLPISRSQKALKTFLRGAPANILLRYRHDQDLSGKIRAKLLVTPPEDWPVFDQLAQGFGLSPASLRRRLRAEGQGFAGIRNDIRHGLACRLLRQSDSSVAMIAARLGYAEAGAFHRAFLKQAGQTPAAFRAQD